jgi:hypothetical protein
MPIGLVSDADFESELSGSKKSSSIRPSSVQPSSSPSVEPDIEVIARIINPTPRGRSDGDVNVPESLRKIIGETSVLEGRQAALGLAKSFGISPSSVSAYANGATSTKSYNEPKSDIIKHINKSRARASKKANHVLNAALNAISQDKLDYADATDLSGIAKDMSVIIKNLEPKDDSANQIQANQPQFTIYAPSFRDERSFEIIQVTE